jgi:hypothetical protein
VEELKESGAKSSSLSVIGGGGEHGGNNRSSNFHNSPTFNPRQILIVDDEYFNRYTLEQ